MTIETTLVPGVAWPYPSKEAVALALQVTDRAKKRRDEVAPKAAKTAKAESTLTDHGRKLLRAKLLYALRNSEGADLARLVGVDGVWLLAPSKLSSRPWSEKAWSRATPTGECRRSTASCRRRLDPIPLYFAGE